MHINHIEIEEFRVFENIGIEFKTPVDKKNVINVITGTNGSGKTSLLEVIKKSFIPDKKKPKVTILVGTTRSINNLNFSNDIFFNHFLNKIARNNKFIGGQHTSARLIYSPAKLAFVYRQTTTLNTDYQFYNEINTVSLLGNAEYYIREYIISKERQSRATDPKIRTQDAVADFNAHFTAVKMSTTLHDLDIYQQNKPIFKNTKGDLLSINQLSDGEKQLYGRVVSLMILNPINSIILIDEPEISLHPSWQLAIMKIYAQIGEGNQFIVATHSPQIIANTAYENLTLLNKNPDTGKIQAIKAPKPSGADVNSILSEVMGADCIPKEKLSV